MSPRYPISEQLDNEQDFLTHQFEEQRHNKRQAQRILRFFIAGIALIAAFLSTDILNWFLNLHPPAYPNSIVFYTYTQVYQLVADVTRFYSIPFFLLGGTMLVDSIIAAMRVLRADSLKPDSSQVETITSPRNAFQDPIHDWINHNQSVIKTSNTQLKKCYERLGKSGEYIALGSFYVIASYSGFPIFLYFVHILGVGFISYRSWKGFKNMTHMIEDIMENRSEGDSWTDSIYKELTFAPIASLIPIPVVYTVVFILSSFALLFMAVY